MAEFTTRMNNYYLNRVLGTPLWLMVYIAPVVNERADTVLILLTFRDITPLKTPLDDDESNKGLFCSICSVLIKSLPLLFPFDRCN